MPRRDENAPTTSPDGGKCGEHDLVRAVEDRKVTSGYGFACKGCSAGLLVKADSELGPLSPYLTTVETITCRQCGESHRYTGQMIKVVV